MKSKISFFNKTLFWKNVTLYWPLWSVYTLMLLMALPINLLFTYNNSYAMFTMDDKLAQLGHCLSISIYIVLIVGMAVATGILVFGYLYNSRNANMIHALPVDRTQLFGTNVLSGLAFMIVPQIITFVVTVFVCLSEGVTAIEYLGIWLLIMMVTSFIAFAVVTICAFCTGNGFGYLIYLVALNFFSTIISSVIQVVINIFGYGASYGDVIPQSLVNLFSPLLAFMVEVDIYNRYNEEGYFAGIEIEGLPVIVIYFVVAIIMYAVAYVIYKKRHIEHAGDLITVGFVKPIFRWGIGTTCGILLGLCISEVFREIGIYFSIPILILVMLCVGIIFYFAADMLVKKSFKVFQKKNWIQCGMFSVFLVVCFGILYQFSNYYEMYIPKQENVKMAYIDYNYSMHFEGEEVGKVIELHKELLSNKDVYEDFIYKNRYNYLDDIDCQTVSINYILENGISCRRYYDIPLLESAIAWIDKIIEIEKVPEQFLTNRICDNYKDVTTFGTGEFEFLRKRYVDEFVENYEYEHEYKEISAEQAKIIYAAILKDAENGILYEYNSEYSYKYQENKYGDLPYISLSFELPKQEKEEMNVYSSDSLFGTVHVESVEYYDYENSWASVYIRYGKKCEHIIQALIETGLLDSVDDIWWGNEIVE